MSFLNPLARNTSLLPQQQCSHQLNPSNLRQVISTLNNRSMHPPVLGQTSTTGSDPSTRGFNLNKSLKTARRKTEPSRLPAGVVVVEEGVVEIGRAGMLATTSNIRPTHPVASR